MSLSGEGEHLSARLVGPACPFHFDKASYATDLTYLAMDFKT